MTVRDTSIEAYNRIKADGLLCRKRLEVYEWLYHHGPATGMEVHRGLGGQGNANNANVRARLNELREMGVVKEMEDTVECQVTKMTVIQWDVTPNLPTPLEKPDKLQEWWIGPNGIAYASYDIAVRSGCAPLFIKHAREVRK
jgi:Fe2+ or Zn2+ uptake regulation protein